MNRRLPIAFLADRTSLHFLFLILSSALAPIARGQAPTQPAVPGSFGEDLREFVETPAVSGYESELVEKIRTKRAAFHPAVDNLGDITVTLGSGSPRRSIARSVASYVRSP